MKGLHRPRIVDLMCDFVKYHVHTCGLRRPLVFVGVEVDYVSAGWGCSKCVCVVFIGRCFMFRNGWLIGWEMCVWPFQDGGVVRCRCVVCRGRLLLIFR